MSGSLGEENKSAGSVVDEKIVFCGNQAFRGAEDKMEPMRRLVRNRHLKCLIALEMQKACTMDENG